MEFKADQVYISNKQWQSADGCWIWIDLEMFAPDNVFGNSAPPRLYVWVSGGQRQRQFAQFLAKRICETGEQVLDQVSSNPSSGYAIRHSLAKCLPEHGDTYPILVREQVMAFFDYYARVLSTILAEGMPALDGEDT